MAFSSVAMTDARAFHACPECGAHYASASDSCALRFESLLALDHSHREPWGSRYGQAFATFALQHPSRLPASLDAAWTALCRIYYLHEAASHVFASLRHNATRNVPSDAIPSRPSQPTSMPTVTIADLSTFAAESYPALLDAWSRATLVAWGAAAAVPAPTVPHRGSRT